MAWSDDSYPTGRAVSVAGFPRALYPPDAQKQGKQPSVDGSDIEAYKRTVSRLGRWPWQTFDDSFSNAFSHGEKSGTVDESGVAGFQHQQHLDATGWIGEKTFNALRRTKIPVGLPHAGEMAMDASAVQLINEAFSKFNGAEPPPGQKEFIRQAALKRAVTQIGVTEKPAGSNMQKYGVYYGMNGVPWCAIFVTWSYELGAADLGKDSPSFVKGSRYAYCPYIVADARAGRNGLRTTDDPIPGDLIVFDWSGDTVYDHIGLFESWVEGTRVFSTVEGNTSPSSNSNGGAVMRRTRNRLGQSTVFVRVAEP